MAETLLQYQKTVQAPDGTEYEARACGSPIQGGTWQGWIEFIPLRGGQPVRTARETTQPNRTDTAYWATGVSPVYLEGALHRALTQRPEAVVLSEQPAFFVEPAPSPAASAGAEPPAVLDPFSVYQKSEAILRKQLGALSAWHLVNIAVSYKLTALDRADLSRLPAPTLADVIVSGVRAAQTMTPESRK
jgi:hypothetical protein